MLIPHTVQLNDPTTGIDGLNCSCSVGATAIRWYWRDTRPTPDPTYIWPPTGGLVRAFVREPDGDPDVTGGTSMVQVAEALARVWQVPMQTFSGISFDDGWDMAADPDNLVAVQFQYRLLLGTRYAASETFRAGHAAAIANAGKVWTDWADPLADGRRPGIPKGVQRIPKGLLKEACAALVVNPRTGATAGAGQLWGGLVRAVPPPPQAEGGDTMYNVGPKTTHRDAVLKAGTVLYRDSGLTVRHSAVAQQTALAFEGSGAAYHVVVNAGRTNYVRRVDVVRIVTNDREFE